MIFYLEEQENIAVGTKHSLANCMCFIMKMFERGWHQCKGSSCTRGGLWPGGGGSYMVRSNDHTGTPEDRMTDGETYMTENITFP